MKRRVVVTGLGVISPNGNNKEEFWSQLIEGKSGIGPLTSFDCNDYTSRIAGEVKDFVPHPFIPKKELRRIFTEHSGPNVKWEFKAIAGHVANEILEYSLNNEVDLIVIATHGLSGLKHFLLGSVAEKVIRRAPCPVLTVKSFGASLP